MKEIDAAINALEGVIRVADRATDEFDAAKAALAGLRSLKQEPVAQLHPNHLKPNQDGTEWCREVLLYSPNNEGDKLGSVNTRVKLYTHPAPESKQEPVASPTAGMNIAQRILHVGGRNNAAGYVEFGSIQAVEALVRQVIRDMPATAPTA